MGFFDLLKKFTPFSDGDDELDEQTQGIFNRQNLILDENTGTLNAKPNIPKIVVSPTQSEKYEKSRNFMSGNRTVIQKPSNPLQSVISNNQRDAIYGGSDDPTSPSDDKGIVTLGGTTPVTVDDLINDIPDDVLSTGESSIPPSPQFGYGSESFGSSPLPFSPNKFYQPEGSSVTEEEYNGEKNWTNNNPAQDIVGRLLGNTSPSSASALAMADDTQLPEEPVDQIVPKEAKDSPKWKDILVGILNNISKADLSKVDSSQRTGAFLGAIAGGAMEGGGTGRYAGKIALNREQNRIKGENAEARKLYDEKLRQAGQRVTVKNNQLAPYFKQQTADLNATKAENTRLNQEVVNGIKKEELSRKITKDEADFRVKMLTYAQKDRQFSERMKQFKTFKTTQNANGTFGLIGVRGDGTTEQIQINGQNVSMPDPSAWAKTLQDIKASELEALSNVPEEKPEDRRRYIDSYANSKVPNEIKQKMANGEMLSKKEQKVLNDLKDEAAADYDKTAESRRTRQTNRAKAQGTRRVLSRPVGKSKTPAVGGAIKGIDFGTQWKQSQKGRR